MKLPIRLLTIAFLITTFTACQQKTTEDSDESTVSDSTETVEETNNSTEATELGGLINPNLATAEDMMTIGIAKEMADQLVEQRPFLDMMDLHATLSNEMDSAELASLYAKMFVPFNINKTDEDNFKIIPGVGKRMAHEFEEYRPYTNLAQFRKEIGKYVDEEEVARLEQYIFVPVELNSATEEDILALPGVGKRMAHEFEEYRPYSNMEQFRKEIGKYVDDKELSRLERFVYLSQN